MIIPQLEGRLLPDSSDEYLYLLLDGSKVTDLERELYQRLGNPLYEPIYLFAPWNSLRELSPCLVQLSLIDKDYQSLLTWFIDNSDKKWGYLFCSTSPLEAQAEILRRQINITTPYGSKVLYKLANPESAWRLFSAKTPFLWQGVKRVWIPSAIGWHYLINTDIPKPTDNQDWQLTDVQWSLLGEVSYQNCLDKIAKHLQTWFPDILVNLQEANLQEAKLVSGQASGKEKNIRYWADFARAKGFTLEQDLFYFFNILAYLGETVFLVEGEHLHPEIWQLLHQNSDQTPSQRIAYAAQLAQQAASGLRESRQDKDLSSGTIKASQRQELYS